MVRPTKLYWKATKHVLQYLRGTTEYGIWYNRTKGMKLQGFTDVYWEGIPSERKTTSVAIFSVGSAIIYWYNRK